MEGATLAGIVTQGNFAIKVLLPGLDARQTPVNEVMTAQPTTVKPGDPLEACMGPKATCNYRHLPVLGAGPVEGVISIGQVAKNHIRQLGNQINFLETQVKFKGRGA